MADSVAVDRYWFLTWTTYGTWLPGDDRGFVGDAPDETGRIINHNVFGTPPAPPNQPLRAAAERTSKNPPVILSSDQATVVRDQLLETIEFRGWKLIAVAIMHTHLHAIVGVPGDPDPEKILGDLFQCAATIEVIRYRVSREHTASSHPARRIKAWCTRKLNSRWGKRASGTWWTTSGSCRKLSDGKAVETVLHYIRRQPNPHVVWTVEDGR